MNTVTQKTKDYEAEILRLHRIIQELKNRLDKSEKYRPNGL